MVFVLRMVAELAVYYYFASFFGGLAGVEAAPIHQLLAVALCCGLSRALSKRRIVRMAPFALLGALLLRGMVETAMLIPAAAYAAYTCYARRFESNGDLAKQFLFCVKIMAVLLVFMVFPLKNTPGGGFIPERNYVTVFSMPFALIFLFVGVYLLRIRRHDESTLKQPRLRLLNAAVLGAVGLSGLLAGASAYGAISSAIVFVYQRAVVPTAKLAADAVMLIIALFSALFMAWGGEQAADGGGAQPPAPDVPVEALQIDAQSLPRLEDTAFERVFEIIVIVAALALMLVLVRHFLGRRGSARVSDGAHETRSAIDLPRRTKRQQTQNGKIRAAYRKFLTLCKSRGLRLLPGDTSLSIHNRVSAARLCPDDASLRLRELYLKARYGGRKPTRDEERAARQCLDEIQGGRVRDL